jgi:hypothetical protein
MLKYLYLLWSVSVNGLPTTTSIIHRGIQDNAAIATNRCTPWTTRTNFECIS